MNSRNTSPVEKYDRNRKWSDKMKKITLAIIVLYTCFLSNAQMVKAGPLYDNCPRSAKFVREGTSFEIDPISGVNINVNTYVGAEGNKKNVVVFGQDPEEEGVGVTVTLTPVTGDIVHNEWVKKCTYYGKYQDKTRKGQECGINIYGYYYEETECEAVRTPGASRKVNDVRVWLEPSEDTNSWLGWKQGEPGGKATLRYMFPEKWMVGTWTEDGFTTTGTPDLSWYSSYLTKIINEKDDIKWGTSFHVTGNSIGHTQGTIFYSFLPMTAKMIQSIISK